VPNQAVRSGGDPVRKYLERAIFAWRILASAHLLIGGGGAQLGSWSVAQHKDIRQAMPKYPVCVPG